MIKVIVNGEVVEHVYIKRKESWLVLLNGKIQEIPTSEIQVIKL